jgi:hypothetical protein
MYKPIKKHLQTYVSPWLIIEGLHYAGLQIRQYCINNIGEFSWWCAFPAFPVFSIGSSYSE